MANIYVSELSNLIQESIKAEGKASDFKRMSKKWLDKVRHVSYNLKGFSLAKNYEHIASQLNSAKTRISKAYELVKQEDEKIEKLIDDSKGLDDLVQKLKAKADDESSRNSQFNSTVINIISKFKVLTSKLNRLNETFEKIKTWESKSIELDAFLNEAISQYEAGVKEIEDFKLNRSSQIVETIKALDSIRQAVVNSSEIDSETEPVNEDKLAETIENSIDNLKSQIPTIDKLSKNLFEANYTEDFDFIRREFEELKELMDVTRQIANNIKSPVSFNSYTLIYI